jgi:hypothetical protein
MSQVQPPVAPATVAPQAAGLLELDDSQLQLAVGGSGPVGGWTADLYTGPVGGWD